MKKIKILTVLMVLFFSPYATAQIPDRKGVLDVMIKTNEYFMKKYADYKDSSFVRNTKRPSHIWTRGVYYEGLMALHQIHPLEKYYNYAFDWAEHHQWGFHRGNTTRNADNQCAAQTYIDLYKLEPCPKKLKNTRICLDMLLNTPQNDDWSWIDAIQMGMPIFAAMGDLTKDNRYFEKMYQMYAFTKYEHGGKGLYNAKEGLWWRDKDFVPPYKEPNGKNCYWSRGNGWVYATYVRIFNYLPQNEKHRAEYIADFRSMSKALKACQRTDGFWNVSLHDESNFGGKETTGTSLFIYGMAWGINQGLLDKVEYLPVVVKAWNAMVKDAVHPNGFLGWVQSTGKEPKDGQPLSYDKIPDFEDYGLGCFLLGASEIYKLK